MQTAQQAIVVDINISHVNTQLSWVGAMRVECSQQVKRSSE